jgi:hypothetical protein
LAISGEVFRDRSAVEPALAAGDFQATYELAERTGLIAIDEGMVTFRHP